MQAAPGKSFQSTYDPSINRHVQFVWMVLTNLSVTWNTTTKSYLKKISKTVFDTFQYYMEFVLLIFEILIEVPNP